MKPLSEHERVLALREAGHVKRCHVLHHGDPGYTVGKHSYDALSLLLALHPSPGLDLIKAVLWHDAGERWMGDVPAPVRRHNRELSESYSRIEEDLLEWLGVPVPSSLGESDRRWLAAVDSLEFLLWGLEQLELGNRRAAGAVGEVTTYLDNMDLPGPVEAVYWRLTTTHSLQRLPEKLPWRNDR